MTFEESELRLERLGENARKLTQDELHLFRGIRDFLSIEGWLPRMQFWRTLPEGADLCCYVPVGKRLAPNSNATLFIVEFLSLGRAHAKFYRQPPIECTTNDLDTITHFIGRIMRMGTWEE